MFSRVLKKKPPKPSMHQLSEKEVGVRGRLAFGGWCLYFRPHLPSSKVTFDKICISRGGLVLQKLPFPGPASSDKVSSAVRGVLWASKCVSRAILMETRYSRLRCSYDSCKRSRFLRAEMMRRASWQHWMFSPGCHKIISTHVSLVEANAVVHLLIPSEGSKMQPSCVPKKSLCGKILPQSSLYLFIRLLIHYFFPFHMSLCWLLQLSPRPLFSLICNISFFPISWPLSISLLFSC